MPLTPNPRIIFNKPAIDVVPVKGHHTVYDTSRSIDLDNVPLNGGFLTKTVVLSAEPYMRGRMRDPLELSYSPTFVLGEPITGMGIVEVLRSEDARFKPGNHLIGMTTWEAYTIQPYTEGRIKDKKDWVPWMADFDSIGLQLAPNPNNAIPWPQYVSVMGIPGTTAYTALEEHANMKKGETIFISSGASAVGLVVVQLAKAAGLRVIASAGSDTKVANLRSLGVDVAFNYKTQSTAEVLAKEPYIDIYWDNVGGEVLEIAISRSALKGRILICGQISEYNIPYNERWGIKNTIEIHRRRLSVFGFLISDLVPKHSEKFFSTVPQMLAEGKLKTNEQVWKGLENGEDALLAVFTGRNEGKAVVSLE